MESLKQKFKLKEKYNFNKYKFVESYIQHNSILIELKRVKKTSKCPNCNNNCRKIKASYKRTIRDLDIIDTKCYIEYEYHIIKCHCGYYGVEELDFVDKYSRYTKRFEKKVVCLCMVMTIKDVAKEMRMSWHSVKKVDKKEAKNFITDLRNITIKKIGVDEIAYQKGHKYLTIVRDADEDKVIWVGEDRKEETLDKFFHEIGTEKSKNISVAVVDMWDPYIASIQKHCSNAQIVFDKFHVAKKVNEALDKVRKQEFAKADKEERINMKHKRFLLLSRQKRLDDEKRETLFDLKDINQNLYAAYLLKEQIADILDESNVIIAIKRLKRWIENVHKAGIRQYEKLIKTLQHYMYGILNYFEYKLTNAVSEGFNNKINVIKRRAYGYRDIEYFVYKIYQLCGIKS